MIRHILETFEKEEFLLIRPQDLIPPDKAVYNQSP